MKTNGALTVYAKELRDILRDRRTIVSMVLVPILFYPVVTIGLGAVISSQLEKSRAAQYPVMVLPVGADEALVQSLTSQAQIEIVPPDSVRDWLMARAVQDTTLDAQAIALLFTRSFSDLDDSAKAAIYYTAISAKLIRGVIELPDGFREGLQRGDSMQIALFTDHAELESDAAGRYLRDWADALRDSLVSQRLIDAGMDDRILKPFAVVPVDVAPAAKTSGLFLGSFLPYMLMILMLTGGMYPAIDITAGEKERNTLETLLAAPVARWELAVGKFLAVLTAGFVTMILSVASMTASIGWGMARFSDERVQNMALTPSYIGWIVLLMLPIAVFFSAILITVAISARSYKEGQSYITPLLIFVVMLAMISMVPGIELNWPLALVPIVNLCLALKDVLMGIHRLALLAAVFFSSVAYAALALFVATRIFQRESVLFRT